MPIKRYQYDHRRLPYFPPEYQDHAIWELIEDYDRRTEAQQRPDEATTQQQTATAAPAIPQEVYGWNISRVLQHLMGRLKSLPPGPPGPGTAAAAAIAIATEVLVVAFIKLYENDIEKMQKKAEAEALIVEAMNTRTKEELAAMTKGEAWGILGETAKLLDEGANGGALSNTSELTLEGETETRYEPEGIPVTRTVEPGITVATKVEEQSITFEIGVSPIELTEPIAPTEATPAPAAPEVKPDRTPVILGGAALPGGDVSETTLEDLVGQVSGTTIGDVPVSIDWSPGETLGNQDVIPATQITLTPARLQAKLGLQARVKARTIMQALEEVTTVRNDKKPRGLWYLAALRFVNRTFGRLTEIDDWAQAVFDNIYVPPGYRLVVNGRMMKIDDWTKLSDLPLAYKAEAIDSFLGYDGTPEAGPQFEVNFEQMVIDMFMMELVDTAIGLQMRAERNIINNLGLRGVFDYGNASTWARRINRVLDDGRVGTPDPFEKYDPFRKTTGE